jgi:hypothetical protein
MMMMMMIIIMAYPECKIRYDHYKVLKYLKTSKYAKTCQITSK